MRKRLRLNLGATWSVLDALVSMRWRAQEGYVKRGAVSSAVPGEPAGFGMCWVGGESGRQEVSLEVLAVFLGERQGGSEIGREEMGSWERLQR